MRYRSKPMWIEAVQWQWEDVSPEKDVVTGEHNFADVSAFAGSRVTLSNDGAGPLFLLAGQDGSQGWVPVPPGHWIVRREGDTSDYWPVDDDHFRSKYVREV